MDIQNLVLFFFLLLLISAVGLSVVGAHNDIKTLKSGLDRSKIEEAKTREPDMIYPDARDIIILQLKAQLSIEKTERGLLEKYVEDLKHKYDEAINGQKPKK
jgi:hypothetical protein